MPCNISQLLLAFGLMLCTTPCAAAVAKQLDARRFPVDKEGIYVVLTSPDMNVKGVCSDYCGWHDKQYYGDTVLAYSIVTDASKCPDTCGYNSP